MSIPIENDPYKFQLCYIDGSFAWFTSVPLDVQWGDDWDDAPYEHNAGRPYDTHYDPPYVKGGSEHKRVEHPLLQVAWTSTSHYPPHENHVNSPWSVQDINRGNVAWLLTSSWVDNVVSRPIHAGTSLADFVKLIKEAGGEVFLPISLVQNQLPSV